jgi:Fur family transcriptional regulator, peroxide stress response regulator
MKPRHTLQRDAILDVVRSSGSHPTADEVYDEVRKLVPHISKGTVYRNLRMLVESGEISELNLGGATSRFEYTHHPHYHFRCTRCGQVFDLDEPVDRDIDKRIAEHTGFTVACHLLEFHGLCKNCQV